MSASVKAILEMDTAAFRQSLAGAEGQFKRFAHTLKTDGATAGKILAGTAKAVAAVGTAAVAAGGVGAGFMGFMIKDGLALNSQLEQATATFTAFTKDASLARQIVADIKKEADVTPFDTNEMIGAGKALISSAKGSRDELMKLIKTAETLAALNPAQGLEGAAFALREAMGGDFVSLQSRFDISRNVIKELKGQGLEGLALVNAALAKMGAGPELVNGLANSYDGLASTAGSFFDQLKMTASEPLFNTLKTELAGFIDYMNGGANESVQDFAKAFGENLNDGVKEIFATIKTIDWAGVAESGKQFASYIGEAASAAAALLASLPDTGAKLANASDRLGQGTVIVGQTLAGVVDPFDVTGIRKAGNAERQRLQGNIEARNAAMAARDTAQDDKARADRTAPLKAGDVVSNWLSARGKTRDDLKKDKALEAEFRGKFGAYSQAGVGDREYNSSYNVPNRPPAKIPVQLTLNQQNPMHTVMAT